MFVFVASVDVAVVEPAVCLNELIVLLDEGRTFDALLSVYLARLFIAVHML